MELDPVDATELAETLGFLRDWAATDHDTLNTSLRAFLGTDGYTIDDLRHDLARFTFRLRGDDGEALFTTTSPSHDHQHEPAGAEIHADQWGRTT